jgi:hypothetical protein
MERYLVNTKRLPCAVKFTLNTDGSTVPIYIVGFDTLNPNTLYFRSRFQITGEEVVTLGLPQSPIYLKVLVWSEDGIPFELSNIDIVPLDAPKSEDPMVIFIEKFARQCGRLRVGLYSGENCPFKIQYMRNIYTDDGAVHPTPARIAIDMPIIQVSKNKFDQDTIPERVIILLHEMSHNFVNFNQDNELEADQNALSIYNSLGYPKIEAVNAFGDIMGDTDDNYNRMLNLVSM